jgi:hypothetical protein
MKDFFPFVFEVIASRRSWESSKLSSAEPPVRTAVISVLAGAGRTLDLLQVLVLDTDVAWALVYALLGGPCANDKAEAMVRDLEALEDLDRPEVPGAILDSQPFIRPASENFGLVLVQNFEVRLRKNSVDSVSINIVLDQVK